VQETPALLELDAGAAAPALAPSPAHHRPLLGDGHDDSADRCDAPNDWEQLREVARQRAQVALVSASGPHLHAYHAVHRQQTVTL
jgi:hypothetical protein